MGKKRKWSYTQIAAAGFSAVILLGGLILMLPVCNADGQWLNFADALFTSCTCVCVTGLVTIVPATQFTFLGKLVLLVLIQVGGWGIIVCAMYLLMLLKVRFSIGQRVILQSRFNTDSISGLIRMLRYVVRASLAVEGAGAVGYALYFVPQYGLLRGVWYSVFHAVSAFCNAGVDILGESSLTAFVDNPWINLVTVTLIISSGLGFMVWQDLTAFAGKLFRREESVCRAVRKLTLHTKMTVIMTALLLAAGTLFYFAAEYDNPATLGPLGTGTKWMAAFFQSVTTRTAGFFTVPQDGLKEASRFFGCILMYIGGSPVGTAGGVKTVTIAVVVPTCWSILKGHRDTECFRRRISAETVRTSISVCVVGLLMVLGGSLGLSLMEPAVPFINVLYEVVSATATVGLTAGVTPGLHIAGKCLVIFLMYVGRIGPVTLPLLIAGSLGRKNDNRSLPEEHIMVG